REAFEAGAATATEGHIQATNRLIEALRGRLMHVTESVDRTSRAAARDGRTESLQRMLVHKERAHDLVRMTERVWDFYFELFTQRQSQFGPWLLACDRIALNCYQACYTGIGVARPVPAPGPFSYMRTGFSPATFRRGIALRQLGRLPNPFPLVQLPYHRLVNPWTLGAVLHEVSHNLQNDLGLERAVPQRIGRRLREEGMPELVAQTWTRWNRESFADLSGLLLGGPAIVASLMDVVGRGPRTVTTYSPRGPHPTPWLRTLLSCELLRRIGFDRDADSYERAWRRLYPDPRAGTIPREMLRTYPRAISIVVDAVCREPFPSLGDRSLMQVIRFAPKDQALVEEAARRLAAGTDPGVVPPRYLIGAARVAFERRYARPGVVTDRFYEELGGR
ncbi:MAG TPA: hypothetical protein VGV67_03315, partial [Solirubrobacteraceae bacterium]|nr:hypothetical protein [Solirubrobacteraceae bacterium]